MTHVEIMKILENHSRWLDGETSGKRADLHNMDLCGVDLRGANLRKANLSNADLSGADLDEADTLACLR